MFKNEDAASLLADVLRNIGHDVRVAHDPATALVLSISFQPKMALLDVGLPVMDGYELAAQIRKDLGKSSRSPVLVNLVTRKEALPKG